MPILCSIEPQDTPLRAPRLPSGLTRNFGTTNRLTPLMPSGPPGILASTRWMMFSARSCSPAEMKILRSEEHTSGLQSLMRTSYAVFCVKKHKTQQSDDDPHNRDTD